MANRDIDEAWRYHDETKHSYESVRLDRRLLDWTSQPRPYKRYRGLEPIPLPRKLPRFGMPALAALSAAPSAAPPRAFGLETLAYLLFFSAGITRRRRSPGGEAAFRAASCTGALYEIDLYVACRRIDGLDPGLYHFDPDGFALHRLRAGDFTGFLAQRTAGEPAVVQAPATLVCTGTYWRNAWKYGARTYRHFGWDNGTILANLLAAAAAAGLPARVVCGFVDPDVNELLGLDVDREVSLALVPIGRLDAEAPVPPAGLAPLRLDTEPYSVREVDYPAMRRMHEASSLRSAEEVAAWRESAEALRAARSPASVPADPDRFTPLAPVSDTDLPAEPLEDVILRRGSTRQFERGAAWTFLELSTALFRSLQPVPADFLGAGASEPPLNDLYLIVHAVEGLSSGAYAVHRAPWGLERLKEDDFRDEAGYLGLEQDLPADASVVGFFLTDLTAVLGRLGNRGYRAANLEAGLLGGRLYLAAYAQRLGATGLTFYDDDVVRFFSPHAQGKSASFCMALGRSVRR